MDIRERMQAARVTKRESFTDEGTVRHVVHLAVEVDGPEDDPHLAAAEAMAKPKRRAKAKVDDGDLAVRRPPIRYTPRDPGLDE